MNKICWPLELRMGNGRMKPVGKRFSCGVCQREFILGPGGVGPGIRCVHTVFKLRKFDEKKVPGLWMRGTENGREYVYLRCQACGWVIKTAASDVDENGFLVPDIMPGVPLYPSILEYHCLTCPHCYTAHFSYLEGWKKKERP